MPAVIEDNLNDGVDPFYLGMGAEEDGDAEWTNPFHPSLEKEAHDDWAEGWGYAREVRDQNPPSLSQLLGDENGE